MTEFFAEHAAFAFFVLTGLIAILGWGANYILAQQSKLAAERREHDRSLNSAHEKIEKSEIRHLVEKLDALVEQMKLLFTKHDNVEEKIAVIDRRLHYQEARCVERERLLEKKYGVFSHAPRHDDKNCLDSERPDYK